MDNLDQANVVIAQMRKTMEMDRRELDRLRELLDPGWVGGTPSERLRNPNTDGGISNDPTAPNQRIAITRAEAYNGLVQQRIRSADFSREYERYRGPEHRESTVPPRGSRVGLRSFDSW